ncbi:RimK family alpha-L-glutamate ligase [Streptomyces sp. NPDC048566]|uniref:ATP-grasp domain-containing protein n=1 Tax=Streptomyces sp. NPDC048566 TaxID=3365569 RepID=UPI00371AFD04
MTDTRPSTPARSANDAPGAPAIVWITNPDNYDPRRHQLLQKEGSDRVNLFESSGLPVRVVHSGDLVPAWSGGGPRLYLDEEDLLDGGHAFLLSDWTWDAGIGRHVQAVTRTIRAAGRVLLNDGIRDPESLGSDKLAMCHAAAALGVPVPPTVAVPFGRYARRVLPVVRRELGEGPYIVKPRAMAMGFGVLKAGDGEQLTAAVDLLTPAALGAVVQPFRENEGDVRVYVHRGRAIAVMLRRPKEGSYLANVSEGGSGASFDGDDRVRALSERLAVGVDADYLCVDWLLTTEGPVFNEWMTVSAAYEDLSEPDRTRVAAALVTYVRERIAAGS